MRKTKNLGFVFAKIVLTKFIAQISKHSDIAKDPG